MKNLILKSVLFSSLLLSSQKQTFPQDGMEHAAGTIDPNILFRGFHDYFRKIKINVTQTPARVHKRIASQYVGAPKLAEVKLTILRRWPEPRD